MNKRYVASWHKVYQAHKYESQPTTSFLVFFFLEKVTRLKLAPAFSAGWHYVPDGKGAIPTLVLDLYKDNQSGYGF